ncbi:SDR family NAD(P)-dependent oxidoreductase [Methyloceanibacter sp.]|uniref:SDR family NAD(P)-dependent oxidoreductase n=1 Tax=Methyloceanibacter sp. TaxID=1965321 RepID=UPI003D6D010D
MRLTGKCAIVTGASQGLGAAIAERFVEEGASLLICARSADAINSVAEKLSAKASSGQQIAACTTDVADASQVDSLVKRALDLFGRIDILVNNAGIYGPMGLTHEVDWNEWVDAISINLLGVVYACRAVTPIMIAQDSGRIVNISGGGATNPLPRLTSYAASKAAVVRFSESLALELKEHGITVNTVAPGALATRMMRQVLEAGPEKVGAAFHERMGKLHREGGTPLSAGADLTVYLASDESAGITGRLISAVWDPWPTLHIHAAELESADIYTLRRIVPADRGRSFDD